MRIITLLVAVMLVFTSCGSKPATEAGPAKGKAPPPGAIPVEKRALVKFADGTLDEYTISDYDPSDVTLIGQNRYSASGGLMDQVEFTYQEETQVLTLKMTKDEEYKLKSRIVYQYNEKNQLAKETVVNKAGKAVSSNEYTYNNGGNVASRAILNGNNVKLAETVYTYQGNLVVASETKDGLGKPISSSQNDYDRDGNLVNQVLRNAAGRVSRQIKTVWQDGREIEITQISGDGVTVQLRITNLYGATGELLKKTIENFQGNSVQVMEFEYEFRTDRGRT